MKIMAYLLHVGTLILSLVLALTGLCSIGFALWSVGAFGPSPVGSLFFALGLALPYAIIEWCMLPLMLLADRQAKNLGLP